MLHEILDFFGRAICHQLKERSLYVYGQPLSVCARDTGIYIGIFSSLIYLFLSKPKAKLTIPSVKISLLLLLFLVPLIVDGLGSYLHFFHSSNLRRLTTGCLFGLVLPYFLYPMLFSNAQTSQSVIKAKKDIIIPFVVSVIIGVIFYRGLLPYYILDSFLLINIVVWVSLCASFLFFFVTKIELKWLLSMGVCLLFLSGLSFLHEWLLN